MYGRRVNHDPRSRNFPAPRAASQRSVLWAHHAPVLDQGDLGSCTGNALAQCLNTDFFASSRPGGKYLIETDAVRLYSLATQLDDAPGQYPPTDTGSDGLSVAKAGVRLGYLTSYRHAFGFDHFAAALQVSPVIVGTDFYNDMENPDKNGFVKPTGGLAGGHEYLALGINYEQQYVEFLNSWSDGWGLKGRFRMTFADFSTLLDQDGDATTPVGLPVSPQPAPTPPAPPAPAPTPAPAPAPTPDPDCCQKVLSLVQDISAKVDKLLKRNH